MTNGSTFKDRKGGLIAFGIFQILLGALCALIVPLMILASLLDKTAAAGSGGRMMAPGMLFYAFLAVWFITMGIGSILARRWARALSLLFSWLWLVCGIGGLFFILVLMPDMFAKMSQNGQMSPSAAEGIRLVMTTIMTVIYVVLPGLLLLFYRSRHVKATCEAKDARTRWTDRRPLPILALSLLFGFWACSMLFMGFYNWALPFFGCILNGPAGAAAAIVLLVLMGYISWGAWHLRMAAWWCAVTALFAWLLSTVLTFARLDFVAMYEKMNLPPQQIEVIKQYGMPQSPAMIVFFSAWFVCFLGYLLYTRKYFKPEENGS
jgi:hypothetical protein